MTPIGQFTARTLRDAMHIAAQLDDRARMTLDAAGSNRNRSRGGNEGMTQDYRIGREYVIY